MLRLEQQRTLRDPGLTPPAPFAGLRPANLPDLSLLARDPDVALRRRALLAIGRVGLPEGVPLLVTGLADAEADVRGSAAFGLGLLASKDALQPLHAALADPAPAVRARVIEALGLIGDPSSAPYVLQAASGCPALLAPIAPDDEEWPKAPEIEICRLALFAFVRLQQYDALAAIALGPDGRPVSRWWPVAYALQRINDKRAGPSLLWLASNTGVYTAGFAIRGLGALRDPAVLPIATGIVGDKSTDLKLRVAAVRAIALAGRQTDAAALLPLLDEGMTPTNLTVEAMTALGAIGGPQVFADIAEHFGSASSAVRAAALAAAAKADSERFLLVLAGLPRDGEWSVRAALASILGTLPADVVTAAIEDLVKDPDVRVHGPALEALAAIKAPTLTERLFASIESEDFVERGTAARLIGETRPEGGMPKLVAAYERGLADMAYGARGSALAALANYGGDDAIATLRRALADRAWPIRWRAAELLRGLKQQAEAERPGPSRYPPEFYESRALLYPAFSPHVFIETRAGTIEIEMNLVDATLSSHALMELARKGFFSGNRVHRLVPTFVIQAGDPRGDGEGGPGFTLPDELSSTPYLRGTVGIALDWRDTGGSQWFIALSPQPHLDAKYTVVGRVVSGWDVLDRVTQWDTIERMRVWDGVKFE